MNDQPQGPQTKHDDAGRVVVVVIGAALVLLGLSLLARQVFWPGLGLERVFTFLRTAGWGLGLIVLGVIAIIWTQRPGFRPPAKGARLYRSRSNRMLGGVLGGVAEYLDMDATLLRLVYVALSLMFGVWPAIVAYVAAVFIVPEVPVGGMPTVAEPQWPVTPPPPPPTAPAPPPPPSSEWPSAPSGPPTTPGPQPYAAAPAPVPTPPPVPWPEGAAAPYPTAHAPAPAAPEVASAPTAPVPAPSAPAGSETPPDAPAPGPE